MRSSGIPEDHRNLGNGITRTPGTGFLWEGGALDEGPENLKTPLSSPKTGDVSSAIPEDYSNSRMGSLAALSFGARGCRENPAAALGFGIWGWQHWWDSENDRSPAPRLLFGSAGFGTGSLGFASHQ